LSGSTERIGEQRDTFGVTTERNIVKQESIVSTIKKEVESPTVKIKVKKDKKKKRGSPSPGDVMPKQSETVGLFPSDPDLRIPAEAVKDRQKMREFQSSRHK
jgi:hypothetical protein